MITKDLKISKMLLEFPQTLEVLVNFSPHFAKLNNKVLRKTLASRVNVEQAAGIAGVNLVLLLTELNKSINVANIKPTREEKTEETMTKTEKPALLKNINSDKIKKLDVRPIIESGKDPFLEIMSVVKSLKNDEVFYLINSFEPLPLYSVMQSKGFENWTEKDGDVFNVIFYKKEASVKDLNESIQKSQEPFADYENVIELDVRELVPPEPMIKILENISRIDEKNVMLVHHHREPMMLYPEIEKRGFDAITNKISENYYKVVITKKRTE